MIQSYSSITRYGFYWDGETIGCPYSYFLNYELRIPPTDADSKYGRFGTVIHTILEKFYSELDPMTIELPPQKKFQSILINLMTNNWDYGLSDRQYKDAEEILNKFAETESTRFMNVTASFMPLHVELKLKDDQFNIRIDKVLQSHTLVDYKTAKELPPVWDMYSIPIKYQIQAGIYAIAYHHKFGIWPPAMAYHFLRYNQIRIVPINTRTLDQTVRIVKSVTDSIESKQFPKNSDGCQWCDMRHVCGLENVDIVF